MVVCLSDVIEVTQGRAEDPGEGIKKSPRVDRGPVYFAYLSGVTKVVLSRVLIGLKGLGKELNPQNWNKTGIIVIKYT